MNKFIQDSLNVGELIFRITDERQIHEPEMQIDDERYIVGILKHITGSYGIESMTAIVEAYEIEFHGYNESYEAFKSALDNLPESDDSGLTYHYQKPVFDEFNEKKGDGKFTARVSFQTIFIKGSISGQDVVFEFDTIEVPVNTFIFRNDKSLISNIKYGNNEELKLITEVLTLNLPITANTKTQELLLDVLGKTFNKTYEVKWTLGTIEKTTTYVSRGGYLDGKRSAEPVSFSIILERALPRTDFDIALYQDEKFWDIVESAEVYNETHNEEITTEQEFIDFLDTLQIDTIGYVVRNEHYTTASWEYLGETDYIVDYNRLDVRPISQINNETNFMNYVENTLPVAENDYKIVVKSLDTGLRLLKITESEDTSLDVYETFSEYGTIGDGKEYNILDFFIEEQQVKPSDYPLGAIVLFETLDDDRFVYFESVLIDNGFIFYGSMLAQNVPQGTSDGVEKFDGVLSPQEFMDWLNSNVSVANYYFGEYLYFQNEQKTHGYLVQVSKGKYFVAKSTSDAIIFTGEYKDSGQYENYKTIPVIDFGFGFGRNVEPITVGDEVKALETTFTRSLRAIILSTEQDIANDIFNALNRIYKIKFTMGGVEREMSELIIKEGSMPVTEHGDLVFEITWVGTK